MPLLDLEYQDDKKFDWKKHIINDSEIKKRAKQYRQKLIPTGRKCGIKIIDDIIVMKPNEIHACTGKKGRGKTSIQQIFFLIWAMANDLHCVMCLQENDKGLTRNVMLGHLLGGDPEYFEKNNNELFTKVDNWFSDHFTFLRVETVKEAFETVKGMKESGINIDLLFLDPINSFESGFSDTGNSHKDEKITAMKILRFTEEVCSTFISQHPTMAGQRSTEDINSYSAEGGYILNKAHFTWAINRENGSFFNRVSVDNNRNAYTGGNVTNPENPLIIEWGAYNINAKISCPKTNTTITELDIIQQVRRKFNPFNEVSTNNNWIEEKELPRVSLNDAFGKEEEQNNFTPF